MDGWMEGGREGGRDSEGESWEGVRAIDRLERVDTWEFFSTTSSMLVLIKNLI
jgi:hypothetical protein